MYDVMAPAGGEKPAYVANAFSLSMLSSLLKDRDTVTVSVRKLSAKEAERYLRNSVSVLGHEGTVKLLNELFGLNLKVNRVNYVANENDKLVVVQLNERLPEGKVLSLDEMKEMLKNGKLSFYLVTFYS